MAFSRTYLAVCAAAIFLTQGESRQLCGLEVQYRGFNPIKALQVIQERQFQEFEQFRNTLSRLQFKLETDDYFAWKRCLSEYEKEKLRYLESVEKCKSTFNELVQGLESRNLNEAQYKLELQKVFQEFQTQFTPVVNLFKKNIKYLYDTIRNDSRRKKWWSTVKTITEEVTTSDGETTKTSTTQINSGIGNQRTQSETKKSQSVSPKGGYDGQTGSSYDAETSYGSSSQQASGYAPSQQSSGYGSQQQSDSNVVSKEEVKQESAYADKDNGSRVDNSDMQVNNSRGGYDAQSTGSLYDSETSGSSSQQATSGYAASKQSSGDESQEQSDNGAVSKEESATVSKETESGSTVDNSDVNFSDTQTRSGLKEDYSTSSSGGYKAKSGSYDSSSGDYRRKRRTLGAVGVGVGVGVSVGVGVGVGGVGGGKLRHRHIKKAKYGYKEGSEEQIMRSSTGGLGGNGGNGVGLGGNGGYGGGPGVGNGGIGGGPGGYSGNGAGPGGYNGNSGMGGGNGGLGGGNVGLGGPGVGNGGLGGGSGGYNGNGAGPGGYNGNNGIGGGNGGQDGGNGGYDNSGAGSGGGYQASVTKYQETEVRQAQGAGYATAQNY